MNHAITTICSTFTGTANPALASAFDKILAAGSALSSSLLEATPGQTLSATVLQPFDLAMRSYIIPLYGVASINDADAANVVQMDILLAEVLEALADTSATLHGPTTFAGVLYDYRAIYSYTNMGLNKKLAMLSCDMINSLNSVGSEVSSEFSVVQHQPWATLYFTAGTNTATIASVSCTPVCVTSTESTTESSTEATTTDSTTLTTSTSSESTSESATADTTTSTELVTSSRIVSGSIQRCLVRPTSVTLTSTSNTATTSTAPTPA